MKTNFPKDFDIEAAVQEIIDDEPDLVAERDNLRAFFRKCVTAVWVKDKVQHDHRIQS